VVGLAIVVYGFATDEMKAIGLGALLIVLGAVLPRLHGAFKFGPGGIEGNLRDQVMREIEQQGQAENLPAPVVQRAITTASEALPWTLEGDPAQAQHNLAHYIARGVYDEIEEDQIIQCMKCDWIGPEPEDGICPGCGVGLYR
jgi:hypothetical protein